MKPVTLFTALVVLAGSAAGIQPAEVENVTVRLEFNASEVYRSGTPTTPKEYSPSEYPYLSSNEPEALVPYGDTEELTNIYMPDGLVAYYPLDETSGNTANDITTTLPDNDGTHVNFDGDELGVEGNISKAYRLEGSENEYIDTNTDSQFDFRQNFSVSVWIKTRGGGGINPRVISKDSGGSWGFLIDDGYIDGDFSMSWRWTSSGSTQQIDGAIDLRGKGWVHFVGSHNGTHQRLFRNGKIVSKSIAGKVDSSSNEVMIAANSAGSSNKGADPYNGSVDDVRIYNRSLSQREVERLYNYSRGQPGTEQISATISSGGFLLANTKGGTPSIESRREAVNSRSLLGRIDPSFGFTPFGASPTTKVVYRSPYNLTGDSFSSASSGISLRNTAGLGDNATVSVAPIG